MRARSAAKIAALLQPLRGSALTALKSTRQSGGKRLWYRPRPALPRSACAAPATMHSFERDQFWGRGALDATLGAALINHIGAAFTGFGAGLGCGALSPL